MPIAAEMVGVSQSMMWKLLSEGSIARVKVGRRTVIRMVELDRFLADLECGGAVPKPDPEQGLPISSGHGEVSVSDPIAPEPRGGV